MQISGVQIAAIQVDGYITLQVFHRFFPADFVPGADLREIDLWRDDELVLETRFLRKLSDIDNAASFVRAVERDSARVPADIEGMLRVSINDSVGM